MTSEAIRNPQTDQLLTPRECRLIIIDYQPIQVSSIRSMPRDEPVFFNIVTHRRGRGELRPTDHPLHGEHRDRSQ